VPPEPLQFVNRPVQELFGHHLGYGFAGLGVSTAIGNYTETDTDLPFPGGLLGLLDWARTYNSLSTTAGALGRGWATSFGASLALDQDPVQFHDTDGRVLPFTPDPADGYTRPPDLDADLIRNTDGTFTLAYNSGEAWAFDATGRLTGKSFEGQTVTCAYDTAGLLVRAAHSSGHSLAFGYGADGRLTQVTADDEPRKRLSMALTVLAPSRSASDKLAKAAASSEVCQRKRGASVVAASMTTAAASRACCGAT
jgi:YD repeat-containing protein